MTRAEIQDLAKIAEAVTVSDFPGHDDDESQEQFALAWTPEVCLAVARLAWKAAEA